MAVIEPLPGENRALDDFLLQFSKSHPGKVLDYGCGRAEFVYYARSHGLDIIGADTFEDIYAGWAADNEGTVIKITGGIIAAPDNSFDVVVSNQVFEHIPLEAHISVWNEISRVLKTDGISIHIFPVRSTIIEAHSGVPFGGYFNQGKFLKILLHITYFLKIGYWQSDVKRSKIQTIPKQEWVNKNQETISTVCYYPPVSKIFNQISKANLELVSSERLLVNFLFPSGLKRKIFNLIPTWLISKLVRMRLGAVIVVRKNSGSSSIALQA